MPRRTSAAAVEVKVPVEDLIRGLATSECFGEAGPLEVVQTHASVVFLTPGHAWKVKKPVRLWGLLDYGTLERRREMCEAEVRLNRRLAPEIYLGVEPIVRRRGRLCVGGKGRAVEHAVRMVRVAEEAGLLHRVLTRSSGLEEEVTRVGRALAEFHAAHRLPPEDRDVVRPSRFARVLRQNFRGTAAAVPAVFPEAVHGGLRRRMVRRLAAARAAIRRRVAEGRMVDGHGDVRLEHVARFRGRIAILDCIEFNDVLRKIDPLSDLAFLAMDLEAHGRPDLAAVLDAAYLEEAPDPDARVLAPLYRAYRAHVRAKVDEQTARDPAVPEQVRQARALGARRHLALAWSHARTGETPPMVVLHGYSGSGKSVLAGAVAPFLRAVHLRSDVVRRELAGLGPEDRTPADRKTEVYGHAMSERTYAALRDRGFAAIEAGRAALLDATYLLRTGRTELRERARALGVPFVIVDVRCPEEIVRRRLEDRIAAGLDPSEADWSVYVAQRKEMQPFGPEEAPYVVPYEAGEDAALLLMRALDALERQGLR